MDSLAAWNALTGMRQNNSDACGRGSGAVTTKRIAMTKPAVLALAFLLLVAVVPPAERRRRLAAAGGYLEHVRYHVKVLNDSTSAYG